ncbi:mechanosensitive ion channel family protein [Lactococcus ileimucosae]|uniref:mechanosensitive ion channel family protein n=1 Tax=Lactococcus ileimucosae TaxID=2941329 RepID=UPI0020440726|nr:mechanosensitive ion channel domain-containing protein [Lactococcus ileimucosae]
MNTFRINFQDLGQLLLDKLIYVVLVSLLFFILYRISIRIVDYLFKNYSKRSWADSSRIMTLARLSKSALTYLTAFLWIYTILSLLGVPVANVLAGAGILGVALGFAGRDLVADIINGFFIIVEHQINVGDWIRFENLDIEGEVTSVGIRSITLISDDGATAFIPNRNIESLKNFSYKDRTMNLDIPVTAENLEEMKIKILQVNADYSQVIYDGIITRGESIFLRSRLTAALDEIDGLRLEIMDKYYTK